MAVVDLFQVHVGLIFKYIDRYNTVDVTLLDEWRQFRCGLFLSSFQDKVGEQKLLFLNENCYYPSVISIWISILFKLTVESENIVRLSCWNFLRYAKLFHLSNCKRWFVVVFHFNVLSSSSILWDVRSYDCYVQLLTPKLS